MKEWERKEKKNSEISVDVNYKTMKWITGR